MDLTLLTPHKKILEKETVDELFVPGVMGTLDILPGYANFVTLLETGVIRWHNASGWSSASVSKGILEIFDGAISIMADVSELGSEIDLTRARTAESKARTKIEQGGLDDSDFQKTELKLKRALARQTAASSSSPASSA